jgi:hypothetical protein
VLGLDGVDVQVVHVVEELPDQFLTSFLPEISWPHASMTTSSATNRPQVRPHAEQQLTTLLIA